MPSPKGDDPTAAHEASRAPGRRMTAPKSLNPPVRAILRSRLHGMLSRTLMLVTVRGRKTGLLHTFPAGYLKEDDALYVLVGEYEKKTWWKNLEGGAPMWLTLRGRTVEAKGEVLRWESDADALLRALTRYVARFPRSGRALGIKSGADGPDPQSIRAAAQVVVMVRARLMPIETGTPDTSS